MLVVVASHGLIEVYQSSDKAFCILWQVDRNHIA